MAPLTLNTSCNVTHSQYQLKTCTESVAWALDMAIMYCLSGTLYKYIRVSQPTHSLRVTLQTPHT